MSGESLKFPFAIRPLEAQINNELLQYFHGERTGFVQVGPEGYFFPHKYAEEAENYYNFQARPDDIWVVSYPRSGTTWTQELVWLVANDLDFKMAQEKTLGERFPFLEFSLFVHPVIKAELLQENAHSTKNCEFIEIISKPGYESLSEMPTTTRRFIKSHFPFSLLPASVMREKCKIIYVSRNPMDVSVSYYHLNRLFRTQGYRGDFPRFWNYFERGLNPWSPYHAHIKEAEAHEQFPNVLLLRYENMKSDLRGTINKVADFLNCPLDSEEAMEKLLCHLSFENFRQNKSVNMQEMAKVGILNKGEAGFVRKGGQGEQKEFVDNQLLLERAKKWIESKERETEK